MTLPNLRHENEVEKSPLQIRAEAAALEFADKARKPLVIEFSGVPKAGKTTTLGNVQTFLKRCGFRTDIVIERASVCPIRDKTHANFNIWTACTTLTQVLEKTQNPPRSDDPQILFLDRGIFDSICWLTMMERISRIREQERRTVEEFLLIDDWRARISAVFVMLTSPEDAMSREQGVLGVRGSGSIMNPEVLKQIRDINESCITAHNSKFHIIRVDTSSGETKGDPKRTAEVVVEAILGLVEEQISENILSCRKETIRTVFQGDTFVDRVAAEMLVEQFSTGDTSNFMPRDYVEEDDSRVQALPIVVVRNGSGDVLRLRRRERDKQNPLHDKVVIWAGGHVRQEDAIGGDPIRQCAKRELEEELRLQIQPSDLNLLGAVYFENGGSTSKHVAIAYEWRAQTDDVSIVLSRSEFFERRGTSLSGSFAPVVELAAEVQKEPDKCNLKEAWSVELIRRCLGVDRIGRDLFGAQASQSTT